MSKEYDLEARLRLLYGLQQIDSQLDEVQELKGDLPQLVAQLEEHLRSKEAALKNLDDQVKAAAIRRDEIDVEILSFKQNIEKYKEQQFQIKTNKQYDALAREIDQAQEKITQLTKEMEVVEGRRGVSRDDREKLAPEIEELKKELEERRKDLQEVNKKHEEEELKLNHEREKLLVRINKSDLRIYQRVREAKDGRAVVPIRRGACGGCYKRVPPQVVLELRKHSRLIMCEHCGRFLVSDEIVETATSSQ